LPARGSGRRPQHNEVLAHDGDGPRVADGISDRQTDRKVGIASTKQGEGFDRSSRRDRRDRMTVRFRWRRMASH